MNPERSGRDNNFNFLRLVFACLVIVSHSFELADGNRSREPLTWLGSALSLADFAVDGFFLVSGYLITQSWLQRPEALHFMMKRVRRIYPAFIVCCIVCAFVVGPLASVPAAYLAAFDVRSFLPGMLLLIGPKIPDVFAGTPYPAVNGAVWSIKYEFACYMLVMAFGLAQLIRWRTGWLIATLVLLAATAAIRFTPWGASLQASAFQLTLLRLGVLFFAGGCFFLYREWVPRGPWATIGAAVLLVCLLPSPAAADLAVAVFGGHLIFGLAFLGSAHLKRFQRLPDVSYGTYLYGWPIQKLLLWWMPALHPAFVVVLALAFSLLAGYISWQLVEKHFLKRVPPPAQREVLKTADVA